MLRRTLRYYCGGSGGGVYYPTVKKVEYEGPKSSNPLAFKFYDPEEVLAVAPATNSSSSNSSSAADADSIPMTMKETLRFSVAYWHSFRGVGRDMFGDPTFIQRPWDEDIGAPPSSADRLLSEALRRMDAAFEFYDKLGNPYWAFHDRDISPQSPSGSLLETNKLLDQVVAHAKNLQDDTGVKLLWGTANLFASPMFMNGAATNPDAMVFAHGAAQVKKALEITKELHGENYVFWGGREGYETLLNTNMKREQEHYARFLHMAVDYAKEIGFTGQFLIEPKPKEPTKHQYDYDVATVLSFLRQYDLDRHFKVNIEANHAILAGHTFQHEIEVAAAAGILGSLDANTGDYLLGWDTDQFPTDVREIALALYSVLRAGGLKTGGLNFDSKLRRPSTDPEDLFVAHVGAMDAYALGYKVARRMLQDMKLEKFVADRYSSFETGIGKRIEDGQVGFRELESAVISYQDQQQRVAVKEKRGGSASLGLKSGKQEYLENLVMQYLHGSEGLL